MSAKPDAVRWEALVARAQQGERAALEQVVAGVRHDVYGLALRMLWHPEDAEDATQEILVRIVTGLGGFRGDSRFSTWVYRVACNHLLTTRRRRAERMELSFEAFAKDLEDGLDLSPAVRPEGEQRLLEDEVKLGCTTAMLLCLDRPHRLAYVLGEVFGVSGEEAGDILDVEPATFRKRLSRARERVRTFMLGHCGIIDPANACRCARRVAPAVAAGRVDPNRLLFATHPARGRDDPRLRERVGEMEDLHATAALYRSHPDYAAPDRVIEAIRRVIDSGRYGVLGE